jgi:hypothetical protein
VTLRRTLAALLAFGAAAGVLAGERDRPTARDAFETRVRAATPDGAPAHPECFPAALVEGRRDWTPEKTARWRAGWAKRFSKATVEGASEEGDAAVVRVRDGKDVLDVLLRWDGSAWVLAAAEPYATAGPAIARANAKSPAKASLAMRTSNDGYGGSAFSFAYVTGDMRTAKGRADVWYCHNGDLHPSGDGRIADLGKTDLAKVEGLPAAGWSERAVPAEAGHVYALRCRREGRYDFHVALRVAKVRRDGVDLEWRLLSTGEGSPASVAKAAPPEDADGSDGSDGLCGKNR